MLLLEDRTKQCARLTAPSFPRRRGRFRLPSTERAPLIDGSRKRPLRSTTNLNNEPGSWAARGTPGACCHLPLRTNDRRQAATRADAEVQARFPAPKARSQPRRHLMRSAAAMRKPSSNPTVASAGVWSVQQGALERATANLDHGKRVASPGHLTIAENSSAHRAAWATRAAWAIEPLGALRRPTSGAPRI